jgi:hypothetical protein
VDELYGTLLPALQQKRILPFLSHLEALRLQVRLNPEASITSQALSEALRVIAAMSSSLLARGARKPLLMRSVVSQLAQTAVQEYEGALAGDRVIETIEYQDARGFLSQALLMVRQAVLRRLDRRDRATT